MKAGGVALCYPSIHFKRETLSLKNKRELWASFSFEIRGSINAEILFYLVVTKCSDFHEETLSKSPSGHSRLIEP